MRNKITALRNVTENPCNMCMPLGAIIPFKGIEQSMVIIHGSQGCSTYMRRHIAEHFNEPIDVASSSLSEKGTVLGGEENLKKGLDNLIKVYQPRIIGILTTCLAETIGEDIDRISLEYLREKNVKDLSLVTVATPGYGGTHTEGYFLALKRIAATLAEKTKNHGKINIIVPFISPADLREIKRILELMNIEYTMFPDYSETLDAPFNKPYKKIPMGGTGLEDIKRMPGAVATIEMGMTVDDDVSPGEYLKDEFAVPIYRIPLPMGLDNMDIFINVLQEISSTPIPEVLKQERGRLIDCMIDSHKYNFQGRSVVYGEPEQTYAIVKVCMENGLFPAVVATGSKNSKLEKLLELSFLRHDEKQEVLTETDFSRIREKSVAGKVNIAIGSSEGRYLTEREGIPLVRIGFPIHDRVGGQRLLSVGYLGTTMFLDRITNTLLNDKYKNYRFKLYREHYRPKFD